MSSSKRKRSNLRKKKCLFLKLLEIMSKKPRKSPKGEKKNAFSLIYERRSNNKRRWRGKKN